MARQANVRLRQHVSCCTNSTVAPPPCAVRPPAAHLTGAMRLTLHRRDLHLRTPFTIARNTTTVRATTIVELRDDDGLTGYGEGVGQPLLHRGLPRHRRRGARGHERSAGRGPPRQAPRPPRGLPPAGRRQPLRPQRARHGRPRPRRPPRRAPAVRLLGLRLARGATARPSATTPLSLGTPAEALAQARDKPLAQLQGQARRRARPRHTSSCCAPNSRPPPSSASTPTPPGTTPPTPSPKPGASASWASPSSSSPCPGGRTTKTADLRTALAPGVAMPLVADEDCQTPPDVERCDGAFDAVNVKLSKCGGPTAALEMVRDARARGLGGDVRVAWSSRASRSGSCGHFRPRGRLHRPRRAPPRRRRPRPRDRLPRRRPPRPPGGHRERRGLAAVVRQAPPALPRR